MASKAKNKKKPIKKCQKLLTFYVANRFMHSVFILDFNYRATSWSKAAPTISLLKLYSTV